MNTLKIEYKENYAIIELNNGKVNAINRTLSADLVTIFSQLENNDSVKGIILTGRPHGFSAGLDVLDLASGDKEATREFWRNYLHALQAMVRFPKPFVCAITGYSPAGATIFTLCADYRIMGKGAKHVIGMHEFKMSMQIPEMLGDIFAYYMGEKEAWVSVQKAKLYNSDEAVEIGLVNESLEVEEVLPRAEKYLQKLMKVYPPVYKQSKEYFRKGLLKLVDRDIEAMVEVIADGYDDPFVQKSMELFLASLKK